MNTLRQLRQQNGLTQAACAALLGMPLRTYQDYENKPERRDSLKYDFLVERLLQHGKLDEQTGLLTLERIREVCRQVFARYDVDYCYLFGSYARGEARPDSDVDLLVGTGLTGLRFFGLAEDLRQALCKKVDLLDLGQLTDNRALLDSILREGVKLYDRTEK